MLQIQAQARSNRGHLALASNSYAAHSRASEPPASEATGVRSMALMLDEVDYGMLLVGDDARVQHANRCARRELDGAHPLLLDGSELRARNGHDTAALLDAVAAAAHRGLRKLLCVGSGESQVSVAVVPLLAESDEGPHAVLLLLGKRRMCEELSIDWFARSHGLTLAETVVLKGLCTDRTPQEIADRQGVELSTVRTQIGSIRVKTGKRSIKALVHQVAMLPPLVGALREREAPAQPAPSAFACMVRALHS